MAIYDINFLLTLKATAKACPIEAIQPRARSRLFSLANATTDKEHIVMKARAGPENVVRDLKKSAHFCDAGHGDELDPGLPDI